MKTEYKTIYKQYLQLHIQLQQTSKYMTQLRKQSFTMIEQVRIAALNLMFCRTRNRFGKI